MDKIDISKFLAKLNIKVFKCNRCGNTWVSRLKSKNFVPKCCPSCKSQYWNKKRVRKLSNKA